MNTLRICRSESEAKNQHGFGTSRNVGSCHQMAAIVVPTYTAPGCREIHESMNSPVMAFDADFAKTPTGSGDSRP